MKHFRRRLIKLLTAAPALLVLIVLACSAPFAFSAQNDKSSKAATPRSLFSADKGKFRILLDGNVIGSEEFEISRSGEIWTARGSTSAHVPGGTAIKATSELKLAADGAPVKYDWAAEAQKKGTGSVEFKDGTAKCVANLGGASPMMRDFKFETQRIAVLDDNLYHQYAVLAQIYDWNAAGKQTFPIVIPQELTPGSISVESLGPQQSGNAKYDELRVSSPDLEILLFLDAIHHLIRLEVPSAKIIVERE